MAAGASSRADREGVGQLLLSAKRTFDRLDLTVRNAKEGLLPTLRGPSERGSEDRLGPSATQPLFLRLLVEEPTEERLRHVPMVLPGALREQLTASLREIEIALSSTERTLRRVLTNGSLGLGVDSGIKPGFGQSDKQGLGEIKPGLGEIKPGLGEIKPGFGEIKPGLGDADGEIKPGLGIRITSDGAVLTGEMLAVTDLVSAVAASLGGLEESLGGLERVVLAPFSGAGVSFDEARQRTVEQAERAFRDLEDRLIVARQTCFWVMRHPLYGLGPVGGGSSSMTRRHIASVGGLGPRFLQLL